MKKFWNLMLAALVIIGATACTENYENIENAESFSFYAEIGDDTRATIDKVGNEWKTTFEGGEILMVNGYTFTNTKEEPSKFTCRAVGVSKLAGAEVTITTDGTHHSLQGKKAFNATATVKNFGAETVKLTSPTSFFRLTYNGESDLTLTLTEAAFKIDAENTATSINVKPNAEEQFIAFWPTGNEVTLSYSTNGQEGKSVVKAFTPAMVYNLGTLNEIKLPEYKIYVHKYKNSWSKVNLYSWYTDGGVEKHPTGEWPGSTTSVTETINGYDYLVWTMPTEANGKEISLIFSNNGASQTADFELGVLNKDYHILLNNSVPSIIEDIENPEPNEEIKVNVYVMVKDLGWGSVYHVDGSTASQMTSTTVVSGYTFYTTQVTAGTNNLVFRNTSTASSSGFKVETGIINLEKDTYFRLSARGAIEIDPADVSTFGYTIYVFDQKSKNVAPNLYVWEDSSAFKNEYGGNFSGWPGVAFKNDCYYHPANDQNWKHYYYYEIPSALYGKNFKFIVNKKGQTSDLVVTKLASDLYVGYWYNSASDNGFWTNTNLSTPITQ